MVLSSNAPLPPLWVPACVKTRDHDDCFILDTKEQTVRKFPQKRTVYVLEHDRNWCGFSSTRRTMAPTSSKKSDPNPECLASYQSCASTTSARARGVKMTCIAMDGAGPSQLVAAPTSLLEFDPHRDSTNAAKVLLVVLLVEERHGRRDCPKAVQSRRGAPLD